MQDPYVAVAAVQARAPVWLLAQARIEGRKKSDFRTTDFSMTDQLCAFSALKRDARGARGECVRV